MVGFVGARARKRKRNIFLSIIFITIICFFIFIFPSFEINNNNLVPNDNIEPDPTEDFTSLASNIEELELSLFQKDQKIKFRDGQINNLQVAQLLAEFAASKKSCEVLLLTILHQTFQNYKVFIIKD